MRLVFLGLAFCEDDHAVGSEGESDEVVLTGAFWHEDNNPDVELPEAKMRKTDGGTIQQSLVGAVGVPLEPGYVWAVRSGEETQVYYNLGRVVWVECVSLLCRRPSPFPARPQCVLSSLLDPVSVKDMHHPLSLSMGLLAHGPC